MLYRKAGVDNCVNRRVHVKAITVSTEFKIFSSEPCGRYNKNCTLKGKLLKDKEITILLPVQYTKETFICSVLYLFT